MIALIVAALLVVLWTLGKSLIAEEIRGRLELLPGWVLRRAAKQLGPEQQTIYDEVWLPDLAYILRDAEGRPITRLVIGARFAVGLLVSTRREARHSQQAVSEETVLELRDPAQPKIALAEDVPFTPDAMVVFRDPSQPSPFFTASPSGGPHPTAHSSFFEAYNGGAVPTTINGGYQCPAYNGGAVPTMTLPGEPCRPSPEATEYVRSVIEQMGRDVRGRISGGYGLFGPNYPS